MVEGAAGSALRAGEVTLCENIAPVLRRMLPLLFFAALSVQAAPLPRDLRGGHFATFTLDARYVDAHTEEWEAFLSVDGGRFYSVRLTPHLDVAVRSYDVLVPNVDSGDVRLLIRTGNERVEKLHAVPTQFRIHADPDAIVPLADSAKTAPESARPGEAAVVVWADARGVESSASIPFNCHASVDDETLEVPSTLLPTHVAINNTTTATHRTTQQPNNPTTAPKAPADILLLTTRMNV